MRDESELRCFRERLPYQGIGRGEQYGTEVYVRNALSDWFGENVNECDEVINPRIKSAILTLCKSPSFGKTTDCKMQEWTMRTHPQFA